jgi:CRISPR/Cas system-associated endonuclease Cas3-HD
MKPVSHSSWPRTDEGLIFLESTSEAVFYASQIYNNFKRVEEIYRNFQVINNRFIENMPCTEDNFKQMKMINIEMGFYIDCLEMVEKLLNKKDESYSLNTAPTA